MNLPKRNTFKICPECGADGVPSARRCWMCDADLSREPEIVLAEFVDTTPDYAPAESFFAVATLFVLSAVMLIGIGLGAQAPGLAVVYVVLVLPALIGSWVRIKRREARVGHTSWSERFVTLAMSGAITLGVLGLLFAALLVALFAFCIVAVTQGSF
ncbi:MAG: hypothetical protein ACC628_07195 [Pirellulaceae bacterium]